MTTARRLAKGSFLLALVALASGCLIAPREGDWDREHNRWYHEHAWHDCGEPGAHCR